MTWRDQATIGVRGTAAKLFSLYHRDIPVRQIQVVGTSGPDDSATNHNRTATHDVFSSPLPVSRKSQSANRLNNEGSNKLGTRQRVRTARIVAFFTFRLTRSQRRRRLSPNARIHGTEIPLLDESGLNELGLNERPRILTTRLRTQSSRVLKSPKACQAAFRFPMDDLSISRHWIRNRHEIGRSFRPFAI